MSADISADVVLIKTGQYNVADLLDPSVSLWNLNLYCNACIGEGSISYIIEIRLDFNNIKPAIWAATYPRTMSRYKPTDNISNFDLQDGAGVIPEEQLVENSEFSSLLEQLNYLPAGTVTLDINIYECDLSSDYVLYNSKDCTYWDNDDHLTINPGDTEVIGTLLASDQEYLQNNVVSELTLLSPVNETDESSPYPWFRWESPGFGSGVRIDYTLYIYQYDPIIHSGPLDAIEDDNYLYFNTEVTKYETGISQQIQVQYPSNSRDLLYGYQYVWFVEGRDIIEDFPFNNQSGIWGWPEPIKSPLYKFNVGSAIGTENLGSPSNGSEVSTVLPTFSVDPSEGVNGYEIWLSNKDDSEVENPIWSSGSLQSNINRYPSDATGLMPGFDYKWKIRANPDSDPGPWSNIFDFNIASYTLDDPSSNQTVNTIFPTFYLSGPSDIAGYELRISNNDDPTVDYGNIYSENVLSLPYELPTDIPISLQPGNTYFWKLIFLDDNDNIVGEIDDYTTVESFRIKEIELISPSNGESNLTLTPSFMWESPIGVPQYEFSLSGSDDPLIENPLFTTELSGTYYQFPQYGSYSLEFGRLYYWTVTDIDGDKSPVGFYSFSTQADIAETMMDEDEFGEDEDEFGDDEDEFGEDGGDFDPPWNDDPDNITTWDEWCAFELNEGCYACENLEGAGLYCVDECVELGCDSGDDEDEPEEDEDKFGENEDESQVDEDGGGEEQDEPQVDGDGIGDDDDEIGDDNEAQTDDDDLGRDQDESQMDEGEIGDTQYGSEVDEDGVGDYQDGSQVEEDVPEIEQSEIYIKPEFALQGGPSNSPKDITVKLLRAVSNADEHIILFSENQNMSSPLEEVILSLGQTEATLDGANVGWGLTIYVQLYARTGGENIGEESNIQVINIPGLPGREDQVGISATYESSSTQLSVEIINLVQNASEYILSIASDAEMSEIFFSSPANSNMSTVYPETADPLIFGNTYFLQVHAIYDNESHGIPSSVTSIFIPNIISPVINEQYSWQPTLPASNSYVIQFSTTDDFTSIVFEKSPSVSS